MYIPANTQMIFVLVADTAGSSKQLVLMMCSRHSNSDKKLSCGRQVAWCFVSLNISLNHSRSLEVIPNDTLQ